MGDQNRIAKTKGKDNLKWEISLLEAEAGLKPQIQWTKKVVEATTGGLTAGSGRKRKGGENVDEARAEGVNKKKRNTEQSEVAKQRLSKLLDLKWSRKEFHQQKLLRKELKNAKALACVKFTRVGKKNRAALAKEKGKKESSVNTIKGLEGGIARNEHQLDLLKGCDLEAVKLLISDLVEKETKALKEKLGAEEEACGDAVGMVMENLLGIVLQKKGKKDKNGAKTDSMENKEECSVKTVAVILCTYENVKLQLRELASLHVGKLMGEDALKLKGNNEAAKNDKSKGSTKSAQEKKKGKASADERLPMKSMFMTTLSANNDDEEEEEDNDEVAESDENTELDLDGATFEEEDDGEDEEANNESAVDKAQLEAARKALLEEEETFPNGGEYGPSSGAYFSDEDNSASDEPEKKKKSRNGKEGKGKAKGKKAKNRMGQRERQRMWEQQFGRKAKHVVKAKKEKIKKAKEDSLSANRNGSSAAPSNLHPSWEAKKKLNNPGIADFKGTKITFD
eukprot:Nk52_evm15s147 gene=Nk52_evmTU15s147